MSEENISIVIADTYPPVTTKPWETNNIITGQMLVSLDKAGILSDLPIKNNNVFF